MADPIKQWANAKLGKGKKPPPGGPPMGVKPGGPPSPGGAPPGPPHPVMGAPPPHPMAAAPPAAPPPGAPPPGVVPGAPPGPAKPPDVRVAQLSWLTPEQQSELTAKEADPPPSWIDPMKWEQAKVQIGVAWPTLPEPRAVAAFMVHQMEQTAKAAAMPPPGTPPAPGAPPHPGAPPPHPGPPRPF